MATINISLLQDQIKKVIGINWILSKDSSLPKPDMSGVISCHLIIRNTKEPSLEHNSKFTIDARSAVSIGNQVLAKLIEIKKEIFWKT